jgi:membrane protein YqaA with SNARE-associated domain
MNREIPLRKRLQKHAYKIHLAAFFLMVLPPVGLYFTVLAGSLALTWILLGLVVLGNILVLLVN